MSNLWGKRHKDNQSYKKGLSKGEQKIGLKVIDLKGAKNPTEASFEITSSGGKFLGMVESDDEDDIFFKMGRRIGKLKERYDFYDLGEGTDTYTIVAVPKGMEIVNAPEFVVKANLELFGL